MSEKKEYIKKLLKKKESINDKISSRNFENFQINNEENNNSDSVIINDTSNETTNDNENIDYKQLENAIRKNIFSELTSSDEAAQAILKEGKDIKEEFTETPSNNGYLKERLKKDLKDPLIISILVLIFTNKTIIGKIASYIPGMLDQSNMTIIGNICRAFIIGIIYYIIKIFVK